MTESKFRVGDVIKYANGDGSRSGCLGVVVSVGRDDTAYHVRWDTNLLDLRPYRRDWLEAQCVLVGASVPNQQAPEPCGRYVLVNKAGTAELIHDVVTETEARDFVERRAISKDEWYRLCKVVATCKPRTTVTIKPEWDNE